MSTLPKGKKKRRKIKRKKGISSKLYFHEGTQQAILDFQDAKGDKLQQQKIYQKDIQCAFDKLVENLINIHGFKSLHDSQDELKADCITFLYQTLHKFKRDRGKKAFSYFNIVAKNFLIIKTKQSNIRKGRSVSLDDSESMSNDDLEALQDFCTVSSPDDEMIEREFNADIGDLLSQIKKRLKNESEQKTIDSIIYIFKHIGEIDLLNKRAVFFYIREMTGLSPKQLTTNMATIKKLYREMRGDKEYGLFF